MTPAEETNERNACDEWFHEKGGATIQETWLEATRRAGWISVEDRLPEQNQMVVITGWSRFRGEVTNVRFTVMAIYIHGNFYNNETGDDFYPPTHWLAIPKEPS